MILTVLKITSMSFQDFRGGKLVGVSLFFIVCRLEMSSPPDSEGEHGESSWIVVEHAL